MSEAAPYQPHRTLDCKGLCCPEPILRTKKAMSEMAVGEILQMVATDPGSKPDIRAFAKRTGQELLQVVETNEVFIFYLRKVR
ncbi:MAG: sulfurtransferase TusA family protein [Candidatus Tectomicrobia bacterium]|uniref:Sulfurtransferase TusA family protein n=1 Tax=Tectimicrobiota bacterium TaxID=2528274 RepID=A0A932CMI4_UNCTE|nr:sulfurtransferase TusA family protein [Candidatus Tectomicrobia bacterium]